MSRVELTESLTSVFELNLDSEQFMVLGLGIGDQVSSIPESLVSRGEANVAGTIRYTTAGQEIRREGAEHFVPYSPTEQFADVLRTVSFGRTLSASAPRRRCLRHVQAV